MSEKLIAAAPDKKDDYIKVKQFYNEDLTELNN